MIMKKWVCSVCGYVYEGANPPAECPVCHVSGDKFIEQEEEKSWAAEHVVGVGKAFGSGCARGGSEGDHRTVCAPTSRASAPRSVCIWPWPVSRTARAIPRSACTGRRPAWRRLSTLRSSPSCWARLSPTPPRRTCRCASTPRTAPPPASSSWRSWPRSYNLDAIHDTVHEMARDEARHGKAFEGLLKRYFGK